MDMCKRELSDKWLMDRSCGKCLNLLSFAPVASSFVFSDHYDYVL